MSKFKKGDKCRVLKNSSGNFKSGTIVTVDENDSAAPYCVDADGKIAALHQYELELIDEPYTKLNPKVGDRFRVVKDNIHFNEDDCVTCCRVASKNYFQFQKEESNYKQWWWIQHALTTKYLEPIEEGVKSISPLEHGDIIKDWVKPQINQSLIKKAMNSFKKSLLSKDTKTLIKAGYMDSESLSLTSAGNEALMFILFENYKKELVASAQDVIDEESK